MLRGAKPLGTRGRSRSACGRYCKSYARLLTTTWRVAGRACSYPAGGPPQLRVVAEVGEALAVSRILAIVCLAEHGRRAFLAPNDVASAARVLRERSVPLAEIPIDCAPAFVDRRIVAVVNDRSCHPTEDRLHDVQELGHRSGAAPTQLAVPVNAGLMRSALIASTLLIKAFDACQEAASHDK